MPKNSREEFWLVKGKVSISRTNIWPLLWGFCGGLKINNLMIRTSYTVFFLIKKDGNFQKIASDKFWRKKWRKIGASGYLHRPYQEKATFTLNTVGDVPQKSCKETKTWFIKVGVFDISWLIMGRNSRVNTLHNTKILIYIFKPCGKRLKGGVIIIEVRK